jgi:hypothetical protein
LGAKLGNGVAQVDRIPENDCGDREVQAGGTMARALREIGCDGLPSPGHGDLDRRPAAQRTRVDHVQRKKKVLACRPRRPRIAANEH